MSDILIRSQSYLIDHIYSNHDRLRQPILIWNDENSSSLNIFYFVGPFSCQKWSHSLGKIDQFEPNDQVSHKKGCFKLKARKSDRLIRSAFRIPKLTIFALFWDINLEFWHVGSSIWQNGVTVTIYSLKNHLTLAMGNKVRKLRQMSYFTASFSYINTQLVLDLMGIFMSGKIKK